MSVDSRQGGGESLDARLSAAASQVQDIVHRWVQSDVTEYDVVLASGGHQLAEAKVMTRSGQSHAIFTHLRLGVPYTVSAMALGNAGGDPQASTQVLDATHPASASVSFNGSNDVNNSVTLDLTLQLDRISASGSVKVVAGSTAGYADGPGDQALFNSPEGVAPMGVAIGPSGTVYVADTNNNTVREITGGFVTTPAGSGWQGYVDGPAPLAKFSQPGSLGVQPDGWVVVADTGGGSIRLVALGGKD